MTDTTKLPEALRIAGILRVTGPRHMTSKWIGEAFLELERQHDRIAELEAQFEARQVCGSQMPESDPQPGLSRTGDTQAGQEPDWYHAECSDPDRSGFFVDKADAEARASDQGGTVTALYTAPPPASPEGYAVVQDGDMWCATGPGFVNLQESEAGFGVTPAAALAALLAQAATKTIAKD